MTTAWASAASFRGTDKQGGANGARIRLEPQRSWEANDPAELASALETLERVRTDYNERASGGKQISLADLIVLAGGAAIEKAAKAAGHDVTVPFAPGRTDASQEQTDVEAFAVLEPRADGFRNYLRAGERQPETLLLDRANLLTLTALAGDDRPRRGAAGPRRQLRRRRARRPHRPARNPHQRRLRQPARHGHRVETVRFGRKRLRRPRPGDGRARWTATAVDLVFGSAPAAPSPRCTPATTPARSSSRTSWQRGSR